MTCGNRNIRIRAKNGSKVKDWVAAINDAGLRPPEGWCHPHRFGSFAPPRGLTEDGSRAQWFIDGQAAFEAIATSIERAKSEVFFIPPLILLFNLRQFIVYGFTIIIFVGKYCWLIEESFADFYLWLVALPRIVSAASFYCPRFI